MLVDMHCHSDGNPNLIQVQKNAGIATILNATTAEEFQFNKQYAGRRQLTSYGVHPWESQRQKIDQSLLTQAPIIGEIGLDSVWTDVPLVDQRHLFAQQLAAAAGMKKPVILHTKGCEQEILTAINDMSNLTVLVHWYSSPMHQDDYIARQHSYFSIGPDVLTDEVVQKFAKKVPLSHLFIESDGLASLSWVLQREVTVQEYVPLLEKLYQTVADLRGISVKQLNAQIEKNWQYLFG